MSHILYAAFCAVLTGFGMFLLQPLGMGPDTAFGLGFILGAIAYGFWGMLFLAAGVAEGSA